MTNIRKKIFDVNDLVPIISDLKNKNLRIVFTNGCFDLIHTGHTRYLAAARGAGDKLIVAVNSDNSVRKIKGNKRPIIPLEERMEVLSGFEFVDFVISFEEPDPYNVIKAIKPNVLIKGGDWPLDKIIGRDIVQGEGGEVFTIPVIPGRSTSAIVERIISLHSVNE